MCIRDSYEGYGAGRPLFVECIAPALRRAFVRKARVNLFYAPASGDISPLQQVVITVSYTHLATKLHVSQFRRLAGYELFSDRNQTNQTDGDGFFILYRREVQRERKFFVLDREGQVAFLAVRVQQRQRIALQ